MLKTFNIQLDIEKNIQNDIFSISENDLNSVQLTFDVFQDGKPFNMTGLIPRLAVKKSSGLTVFQDCRIVDAVLGTCEVTLTTQSYMESGLHTAELHFYNETIGGEQVAVTGTFKFDSRQSIMNDETVISSNEWQAINELFDKFTEDINNLGIEEVQVKIDDFNATVDLLNLDEMQTNYDNLNQKVDTLPIADIQGDIVDVNLRVDALPIADIQADIADVNESVNNLPISDIHDATEEIKMQQRGFKKGRPVELFNNITDWALQSGFRQSLDATIGRLKITSNGTPASSRKAVSFYLAGSKVLKIRVFIENLENLSKFSLYFANDSGYANFLFYATNGYSCVEGWNDFYIDTTKFSKTGTGTFNSDIVSMQLRVEAKTGTESSVTFVLLVRDETQKPQLIFSFDDGWISQYTEAFTRMQKRGIPGTIAVVPSLIGTTGYMTLEQLKKVYDYGWDLANHTFNHVNLKNVDAATIKTELDSAEQWLIDQGFIRASDVVVYPQGGYKEEVITEMQTRRAGRSIVESIEAGLPSDKYKIKIRNVLNTITPTVANGWIDEIINSGGTLILLWHIIDPVADTSTKYTPTDLQTIIDYAYSKKDLVDILTFTEYLERCNL